MDPIDLGCEGPNCPISVSSQDKPETYYPTLHIDASENSDLAKLPDEGEMEIKFCVKSRTITERDGKKTVSLSIEVRSIEDVEASEVDEEEDAGDILDRYAEEESKK